MLCSNKCARILFVHIYLDCRKVSYLWHGSIVPDVNSMQSVSLYFGGQDEQIYITRLFIGVRIKKTCKKNRNETTEDMRRIMQPFLVLASSYNEAFQGIEATSNDVMVLKIGYNNLHPEHWKPTQTGRKSMTVCNKSLSQ